MTDTKGAVLVAEAMQRGMRIAWDPPRYKGPADALALVKKTPDAAREVLRRAVLFRAQLQAPGPVPFLVLPDAELRRDGCLSCGVDAVNTLRCPLCRLAAWMALELVPPDGVVQ